MQKSKSSTALCFDILEEEDENKRVDKVRRASLCFSGGTQGKNHTRNGNTEQQRSVKADTGKIQEELMASPRGDSLTLLNPEEMLKHLLKDLYIDANLVTQHEVIGEGGFATVHKSSLHDPETNTTKIVAVKVLKPDLLNSPGDLREFLMEADLQRKLKHRSIVKIIGIGSQDMRTFKTMRESIFVVQEFMGGGNLKELILKQMLNRRLEYYSTEDALNWLINVAEALNYLHSVCRPMIIHRDMKLENILLDDSLKEARLCDFGLHKRLRLRLRGASGDPTPVSDSQINMIQEGSYYGGTLYYSAQGSGVTNTVSLGLPHIDGNQRKNEEPVLAQMQKPSKLASLMDQVGEETEHHYHDISLDSGSVHGGSFYLHSFHSQLDRFQAPLAEEGDISPVLPTSMTDVQETAPPPGDANPNGLKSRDLDLRISCGQSAADGSGNIGNRSNIKTEVHSMEVSTETTSNHHLLSTLSKNQSFHSKSFRATSQSFSGLSSTIGNSVELTQKVGSAFYMAPEVVMGKKYNEKVDVFGFAIIMYEVLTRSVILIKYAMVHTRDELASYGDTVAGGHREEIPGHWPEELRALISECWAQQPDERPAFGEVISRLMGIRDSGVGHQLDSHREANSSSIFCDCGCILQ